MPGVQGGTAIAATVFGENNPGGKLIATMYHSSYINETDFLNMSMTNGVGRSYKYYTGTPLFPFGYVRTPPHAPVPRTADARHSDPWLARAGAVLHHVRRSVGDAAAGARDGARELRRGEQTERDAAHLKGEHERVSVFGG